MWGVGETVGAGSVRGPGGESPLATSQGEIFFDALDATEHWFVHDGVPTLTMVVRYREVPTGPASRRAGAIEPTIELEPEHRAVFEALRKWRNERAKRDGRPPYVPLSHTDQPAAA